MDFFLKERGGGLMHQTFYLQELYPISGCKVRKVYSYNITAAIINTQYNEIQREYPHYIRIYTVNRTPPFSM